MRGISKLGRYELRRILGKGAMGVVYEGYDPTLSRRVAVKTILKSVAHDDETERNYAERFVREAKAVARLNHPNIVQVHDFGVEGEVAYLVMEFIQGRELRDYFVAGEAFEAGECIRIMGELLDALDFAHEAGVIHRDVKPANVMLDAQRRVKLADFGVARVQDSDRSAAGTMVGTPAFMSPEQISGGKVDRRSDLFSAGTILYQLLTGEQPFKGEGAWTVAKQIMQDDPPAPSSVVKSASPAFDAIVEKALAKNPAQRFASAREFAVSLRGALGAGAPVASGLPPKPKAKPEARASDAEVEFWRAIQNSVDAAEFEFYLEQFPEGTYAPLARHKITKLKEPIETARKAEEEKKRQEAEARAKREAEERAQHEAAERARREAEEKARREAEEKARLEAAGKARREAEENAKREAAERTRRETEEKIGQAQALARLKQQEDAAVRAKAAVDKDATVAMGGKAVARPPPAERKASYAIPIIAAIVVVAGSIGAYFILGRKPAPEPVAEAPAPAPAPAAPPKVEVSAAEIEKIKKETEERVRREYADKSAAEQAAAAKAATEKATQEKVLALKAAAAEKAAAALAAERAAAEKAAAARAASEKASLEKANAERAAAERAAAEKATAEKAAAEKSAAEKAATEKLVAEKAAAANSVEAQLERFIQRKGRDKVLKQEPGYTQMRYGEIVYVNDGSCPPGRIREVTGVSEGEYLMNRSRSAPRPSRCISLADDKPAAVKPPASKPAAAAPAAAAPGSSADADAQLERFIQRKGRDKVLKQEPLGSFGTSLRTGEVIYINDGACPPGKIREVTGTPGSNTAIPLYDRPSRCISLTD